MNTEQLISSSNPKMLWNQNIIRTKVTLTTSDSTTMKLIHTFRISSLLKLFNPWKKFIRTITRSNNRQWDNQTHFYKLIKKIFCLVPKNSLPISSLVSWPFRTPISFSLYNICGNPWTPKTAGPVLVMSSDTFSFCISYYPPSNGFGLSQLSRSNNILLKLS